MNCFAGGVSLRGSGHSMNQDSMAYHNYEDGWLLAVSDGLGSRKKSQIGSAALCNAAWICACQSSSEDIFRQPESYVRQVHQEWLSLLEQERVESIDDCCATVLILMIVPGKAIAIQLGDGFIALCADDAVSVLLDDKSEHFINETDCFQEEFALEPVRYEAVCFESFQGALLCSDGVEIGDMSRKEVAEFSREFVDSFSGMHPGKVNYSVGEWLRDWPGADDKTTVYLLRKGDL